MTTTQRMLAPQEVGKKRRSRASLIIMVVLGVAWMVVSLFPVWMVFSATFSSDSTDMTKAYLPNDFANGWEKVLYSITTVNLGGSLIDTFFYTSVAIVGMLLICTLAAYEFSFFQFPGKSLMFTVLMGSMMLPLVLYVVPLYRFVFNLGLADTYLGVALPLMVSPLSVFILMQFMEDLPRSFIESAQVDGAGHFRIFFSIVMPLMRNGMITATILLFLAVWGAFLWPSLVTGQEVEALSVTIANMFNPNFYVDPRVRFAAMLLALIPPVLVYIVFQRYVIKGISMSGVKG
ncbi:carbohydrate ABC transporter permease [Paramicrobacterium agarici]|uniref:carbohydrate ABC transporter permease n=1 Tax=Paramicrobacterium agarici TaxID=630514 RepID=UPI00116F9C73|nr:carbohydrate ABC transporter permease [Microbacterium agarici]TQO22928.1 carbohydrate ABC transporter membrane protein 2 (CUT1 family) [Microbacterium agarici]